MEGKARATKWRAKQVADGGKSIGLTLTARAAKALESIQTSHNCSQREAVSLALELAAGHPGLMGSQIPAVADGALSSGLASQLEAMEQRLRQMECRLAEHEAALKEESLLSQAEKDKRQVVSFTARQMLEHGERMSRVRLHAMAKEAGIPVPDTLHEYNVFISYHMDFIREIMRRLK
jgi:uncharacterized coiled-coil protein SlyX